MIWVGAVCPATPTALVKLAGQPSWKVKALGAVTTKLFATVTVFVVGVSTISPGAAKFTTRTLFCPATSEFPLTDMMASRVLEVRPEADIRIPDNVMEAPVTAPAGILIMTIPLLGTTVNIVAAVSAPVPVSVMPLEASLVNVMLGAKNSIVPALVVPEVTVNVTYPICSV